MKRSTIIIRIIVTWLMVLGVVNTGIAGTASLWNQEMAQKLVSQGWEDLKTTGKPSIVIYSFQFAEVDSSLIHQLNLEMEVQEDSTDPWGFTIADRILKVFKDQRQDQVIYDSWIMTLENKPITIHSAETQVSNQQKNVLFEMNLLPLEIDLENKQVLTRLQLASKGSAGAIHNVSSELWANASYDQPVALISRRVGASGDEVQTLALYLQCMVVSPGEIPTQSSLLTVGDLTAFHQMMGTHFTPRENQVTFFLQEDLDMELSSQASGNQISGEVLVEEDMLDYHLRYDHNISGKSLALSTQVGLEKEKPVLRLGVTDQVDLNSVLIRAAYLPICYDGSALKADSSYLDLVVKYQWRNLKLWYEGEYFTQSSWNRLGLGYTYSPELELLLVLEQGSNEELELKLGFKYIEY